MTALRYRITHDTRYRYDSAVLLSQQLAHLRPRDCAAQTCDWHLLSIAPQPSQRIDRLDFFGNPVTQFALGAPHDALEVRAESLVSVHGRPGWADPGPPWQEVARALALPADAQTLEASQFLHPSPHIPLDDAARAFARASFEPGRPIRDAVDELMRRIHEDIAFDPRATTVNTSVAEVLELRRGVCQDFAHLMIACLRALGLAARYVSGYILTSPPPGHPRLIGADASHAWVSVYCPGEGWMDFDPTNDLCPDLEHVRLGWGRDFSDVSPLRGVILGGGNQELEVRVSMVPVHSAGMAQLR